LLELESKANELAAAREEVKTLQVKIDRLQATLNKLVAENLTLRKTIVAQELNDQRAKAMRRSDFDPLLSPSFVQPCALINGDNEGWRDIPGPCPSAPPCPRARWKKAEQTIVRRIFSDNELDY
jgi:hypothetical protein